MADIHTPKPHPWVQGEPSLQDVLNDPTIRTVMNRDGVRIEDLTELCAIVRKRLIAAPVRSAA